MPVYIYRCQSCGAQFEKTQKFNARPLTRCPECRQGKVKRLLQRAAIIFKGSGWYATDQRSAFSPGSKLKAEDAPAKVKAPVISQMSTAQKNPPNRMIE